MTSQADLKPLKYLDWCLNETLRLYPAVPSEGRICIKSCVLPTGEFVPEGTFCGISSYLMQRRADYYPDPLAFKPERWAEKPPHPYAFVSFYGGPQVCLGQSLALVEAKTIIVHIMKSFRLRVAPNSVVQPLKQIVLRAKFGMQMTVHSSSEMHLPVVTANYSDI